MAADTFDEDAGARRASTRKRLSGKKLILFVILPVLLVIGAAAGLYFSGALSSIFGGGEKAAPAEAAAGAPGAAQPGAPIYWDLPDILVNLRTDGPRPQFLKISVSLELDHPEDRAAIERVMPRVTDTFQVYLRELTADQLRGSAGLIRLREELLSRINTAVAPAHVKDVLFREMLIQ
ncbi:MAG TPA: flagellar basal body-associated FliL family protein [Candidatus Sulfotelmatobacter sp.]|nr:flagellar basal body-associated FliL family protein [Candidatus Sulfotelmatobacter sp.]